MSDNHLLLLLIAVPLALGFLCYISPFKRLMNFFVAIGAIATMGLGCYAAYKFMPTHASFAFGPWLSNIAFYIELALLLAILAIAIRIKSPLIFILGLAQLGLGLAEQWHHSHSSAAAGSTSPVFIADTLSLILVLVVTVVGSIIVLYAIGYMKNHEHHAPSTAARTGRFFLFLVGFLGLMNGLVLANDLRWLSIFWEGTTLCSFFLIGHDRTDEACANAKRALLLNSIGGVAMIGAGVILSFSGTETTLSGVMAAKALAPMALLCLAALTKSAQMPFQSWLLGAMVAPTPVSALLHSATMVKAGSYLVLRLAPAFSGQLIMTVMAVAGAFTFALTSALAVSQNNAKKVLAYSTIANLGLIVACAGINTPLAYSAALMILCFHAVSKGLLFLCVGTIEQNIGSRDIEDMGHVMFRMPLTTTIALIGMVSMLIPPFGMLMSKWMAIESAIFSPWVLMLIVVGSALTVLFWAKWMGRIQTVSYHEKYTIEKLPLSMAAMNVLLVIGVIVAGVLAVPIYKELFNPLAVKTYQIWHATVSAQSMSLLASSNQFLVWPILMFLILPLIAWAASSRSLKKENIRLPYMCGENVEGQVQSYMFRSLKDASEPAWAGTLYLKSIFNEQKITFWANTVAMLILLAMFGVIKAI